MIRLPSLQTGGWGHVVRGVAGRVGRRFGFQAFSTNPKTREAGGAAGELPSWPDEHDEDEAHSDVWEAWYGEPNTSASVHHNDVKT